MTSIAALWASIILNGLAQIVLKKGLGQSDDDSSGVKAMWWFSLVSNPWVWAWGLSFTVATALWLLALSQLNISFAFPLLSSSFVLVAILSRLLLREYISWRRWVSIVIISIGVILIAAR